MGLMWVAAFELEICQLIAQCKVCTTGTLRGAQFSSIMTSIRRRQVTSTRINAPKIDTVTTLHKL
jgi:hypothetical protein